MMDVPEDEPTRPITGPSDLPALIPTVEKPKEEEPDPKPRKRGWFVVLAWATLIGLALFTAWITIVAIRLPGMLEEQGGGTPFFYP